MDTQSSKISGKKPIRIVILGGGFGGIYVAYHLEKSFRKMPQIEITLVSRDNYFLMTPLLFEAGSGILEPRHAVNPIRPMLKRARFVEADIERIDLVARRIYARHTPDNHQYEIDYEQLVLALGGITNRNLIPGSEHAFGFKTLGDAIFVRNRIIDLYEQADVETDPVRRKKLLTVVVIGGGLVGVELMGELTEFMRHLLGSYPRISGESLRFVLVEMNERILPEMEADLAAYSAGVLQNRGVEILTKTKVKRIEPGKIFLPGGDDGQEEVCIEAETILLAAGIGPNPLLADLPVEKAKNGRVIVEGTMRNRTRPEVWALGDCASIPGPDGKPYPPLAQHALREAKVLAKNVGAVIRRGLEPAGGATSDTPPKLESFVYRSLGMLASLGHYSGAGRVGPIKIRGFIAWWVWRTYYVMQMTRWERRLRVIIDWTIALFFANDIVKLDLFGDEHPSRGGGFQSDLQTLREEVKAEPKDVTVVDEERAK